MSDNTCGSHLVQEHCKILGSLESEVKSLRSDVDRHEGIYQAVLSLSVSSERTLVILEQQASMQEKILAEIDMLTETSENKGTVQRIHERVDILERKDANEALALQKRFKNWLMFGFGTVVISVATVGVLVLLKMN